MMIPGPPLGPEIVTASPEAVLAALEQFDPDLSWQAARPTVIPMLPRQRPYPLPVGDRVTVALPPGIDVGFGLDLGPAVAFVVERQLAGWGVDRATLVAAALDNVRRLAQGFRPSLVVRSKIGDVPTRIIQTGEGIASALLLAPDTLPRLIGNGPHVLLAPMRDVLIALPSDVDPAFAAWLAAELASMDPNCLRQGLFRHTGGRVIRETVDRDALLGRRSVANAMH